MSSLLPFTATDLEKATEQATNPRLPVPNAALWNPLTCPVEFLPWLAHSLSVDSWDPEWPEEVKRDVIASVVFVHRRKGTVGAVREAIRSADLGEVEIIEGFQSDVYDGSQTFDGSIDHEGDDHWAEYRIIAQRPVSIKQAAFVRRSIIRVAPTRCKLKVFDFREAGNLYNGAINFDGAFTHGVV